MSQKCPVITCTQGFLKCLRRLAKFAPQIIFLREECGPFQDASNVSGMVSFSLGMYRCLHPIGWEMLHIGILVQTNERNVNGGSRGLVLVLFQFSPTINGFIFFNYIVEHGYLRKLLGGCKLHVVTGRDK